MCMREKTWIISFPSLSANQCALLKSEWWPAVLWRVRHDFYSFHLKIELKKIVDFINLMNVHLNEWALKLYVLNNVFYMHFL